MIKKIFTLIKIVRKVALSDALKVVSKIHQPPFLIKLFVNLLSISFKKSDDLSHNLSDEEKLCKSIEGMGTTFIKLGQFLATRPDIISEDLSKHLEKLQDKLPPFLDRQYTVFGKVIEGMEFVDKIKRGDENNNGSVSDPDKIISFKSL